MELATRSIDPDQAATHLHQLLLEMTSLRTFLDSLATVAAAQVADGVSCGLTVLRDGRFITVAASDDRASQVDEIQYSEGVGPCLHALREQEVVIIKDIVDDERWTGFRTRAMTHGVGSVLSLPLNVDDRVLGALNFYGSDPLTFGQAEQDRGDAFAAETHRALALAVRLGDQMEMTDQMRTALTARSTIDQALGVIMTQNRCNAEVAFATLRAESQTRNVKLRDVAKEIVTLVGGEPAPPPAFIRAT